MAEVLLLLPYFASLYHFLAVVRQAGTCGRAGGTQAQFAYLLSVGGRHPHLRRSQLWAVPGGLYFLAPWGAWITSAEFLELWRHLCT